MGRNMRLEEMLEECAVTSSLPEEREEFSGHSCLLVTWKTNPEIEQFKELYMEKSVKTHKRKNKQLVDPGDLVSFTIVMYLRLLGIVAYPLKRRCQISHSPASTKYWARYFLFTKRQCSFVCVMSGRGDGASSGEGEEGRGFDSGRRSVQIFPPCRWNLKIEMFCLIDG